jgi:hypothetical protein
MFIVVLGYKIDLKRIFALQTCLSISLPLGKLFYRMKSKPYFQELMESVDENIHTCYPPKELILMR